MSDRENGPKKIKRRRGNTLENWEVALVKAMIARGVARTNDQDILAYFTRPTRTVNHRLIGEIRTGQVQRGTGRLRQFDCRFEGYRPRPAPRSGLVAVPTPEPLVDVVRVGGARRAHMSAPSDSLS